ncbi:MAG: hypothetical protein U0X20_07455 [Caldilineaceae bacterium]
MKLTTLGCTERDRPPGVVHAFKFPGLMPSDNSTPRGLRGDNLFVVPYCEVVEVVDYAWSSKDEIYYVRIRLADGSEGWIVPIDVGISQKE